MLIPRDLNDRRVRGVTINGVTISKDLKNATVFISRLSDVGGMDHEAGKNAGSDQRKGSKTIEQVLNHAAGYLRRQLSQHIELRVTPNLLFKYDDSIKRGVEISTLIDALNEKTDQGS